MNNMKHAVKLNKLIVGTVQMGLNYGINNSSGKISEGESIKILQHAFSGGITLLDTAEAYGNSHQVIGSYHKRFPYSKFRIITKIPKNNQSNLLNKAEKYVEDLLIDRIDVLMYHSFETFNQNLTKSKEEILELKDKGLITESGVSVYTNEEFEQVIEADWIDIIQFPFNIFDNVLKRGELMAYAKERGKVLHTRSAFLQGLFFIDRDKPIKIVRQLRAYLLEADRIAEQYGMPLYELALAYCLNQAQIDNVLIGVDNITQLTQSLEAANAKIPWEAISELNKINIENIELLNPSLWEAV